MSIATYQKLDDLEKALSVDSNLNPINRPHSDFRTFYLDSKQGVGNHFMLEGRINLAVIK